MPISSLDFQAVRLINQYAGQSEALDNLAFAIADNGLLKGGLMVMLYAWAWFRRTGQQAQDRLRILATGMACVLAIAIGRLMQWGLPFRPRPQHEASLGFNPPLGSRREFLDGWSSFPSDHAVLFFTLAVGLVFLHRAIGTLALAWAALVIGLPRVYLGFHYPSDILVGACIGVGIGLGANLWFMKSRPAAWTLRRSADRPELFYPVLFLVGYQIADMFNSARVLAKQATSLLG